MAYKRLEQRRADRREKSAGAGPPTRNKARPTPEGGSRQAWTRVRLSGTDAIAERLTPASAGAVAAGWTALICLLAIGVIVITVWVLGAGAGGILDVMKVSGTVWLATHMIPVAIPAGAISVLPLGFALIPAALLWRGGRWATRRASALVWQDVRLMTITAAAVYATIAMLVAGTCATEDASVEPLYALFGAGIFALVAFGAGASFEAGLWPTLADRFTFATAKKVKAAVGGFLVLLAGATLVLAIALIFHFSASLDILQTLSPGVLGNIMLAVLSLAYLPNAMIWALAYVTGPGFAIGDSTFISPLGVDTGPLPAFPLFSAVPDTLAIWAPVVFLIPLLAGGFAARILNPHMPLPLFTLKSVKDRSGVAGLIAAAVFVLCILGSGSLGSDRLASVGPIAWRVAVATFVLMFVGGWLGDGFRHAQRRRGKRTLDLRDGSADRRLTDPPRIER